MPFLDFVIWLAVCAPSKDKEEFVDNKGEERQDACEREGENEENRSDGPSEESQDDLDGEDLRMEEMRELCNEAAHVAVVDLCDEPEEESSKYDTTSRDNDNSEGIWLPSCRLNDLGRLRNDWRDAGPRM